MGCFALWDLRTAETWAYFVAEYEAHLPGGVQVENIWLERTLTGPSHPVHLWSDYPELQPRFREGTAHPGPATGSCKCGGAFGEPVQVICTVGANHDGDHGHD